LSHWIPRILFHKRLNRVDRREVVAAVVVFVVFVVIVFDTSVGREADKGFRRRPGGEGLASAAAIARYGRRSQATAY
jgi:hypothetical protein